MIPNRRVLALVESPVQFLHTLEWNWAMAPDQLRIAVLSPHEATGRRQLSELVPFAQKAGIEVEWFNPRTNGRAFLAVRKQVRQLVADATDLVIGDPFSGLIQSLLPTTAGVRFTVIDDGTATIDFADLLKSGAPLSRWTARPSRGLSWLRRSLGHRASQVFHSSGAGQLDFFTALPVSPPDWVGVSPHHYEWTKAEFAAPAVTDGVAVVGSSLVESGVLRKDAYVEAIAKIVEICGGPGRYLAHRRENPEKLAELTARTGLSVMYSAAPLELEFRRGPVGSRVICFPSTPAYTLPMILADVTTAVTVVDIEDSWFHPDASRRAIDFIGRMATQLTPIRLASLEKGQQKPASS